MGNKVKASTKKFVKNKLAGAIKKRREKQRHAVPVRAVVPRREESKLAKHTQKEEEEKEEDNDNKDQQGFEDFLEQELQDFEVDEEEEEEEEEEQLEEDDDQDDDDDDDLQAQHNAELQQLRDTDPEFFAFLQKNDPSLLQFGDEAGDQDQDEEQDELEERPAWVGRTGKRAVAKGCREFDLVCKRLTGEGANDDENLDSNADETVIRWGLGPGLRLAATAGAKAQKRAWGGAALLVNEAASGWRALALEALAKPECWNKADTRAVRAVGAAVLALWTRTREEGERAACTAVLRGAVLGLPHPHGQRLVRAAHAALAGAAGSGASLAELGEACEVVAELHGLLQSELAHALLYGALRQHALALRNAKGFSWALLLSLRATVLCISRSSALRSLLYPASHVVMGFLQVTTSPVWIPAQLLLIDLLLLLSPLAYIPIASCALRLLTSLLVATPASLPQNASAALPDTALRAPKALLAARGPVRETMAARLLGQCTRQAAQLSRHASFPEWAAPVSRQLRYLSRYAPPRSSRAMHALAGALDAHTRAVLTLRSALKITPKTGAAIAAETLAQHKGVLPLETFLAKTQHSIDWVERAMAEKSSNVEGEEEEDNVEGDEQEEDIESDDEMEQVDGDDDGDDVDDDDDDDDDDE